MRSTVRLLLSSADCLAGSAAARRAPPPLSRRRAAAAAIGAAPCHGQRVVLGRWLRGCVGGGGRSYSSSSSAEEEGSELNPETVSYLVDKTMTKEVYLVGTAHVSEASARDVRQTIRIAKPSTVMVELCPGRARRLKQGGGGTSPADVVRQFLRQVVQPGPQKPGFGVEWMLKLGFAGFYALLRQYGLTPGQEFKVALEEADRLGLYVCYGDRGIDETLSALRGAIGSLSWEKLANAPPPPPEIASVFGGVFSSPADIGAQVEGLKHRRQITALRDYVTSMAPEVMDVMVRERDVMMTDALLDDCRAGRIVAVVGMAHLDGIEEEWRRRGGEVFLHGDNSLRRG